MFAVHCPIIDAPTLIWPSSLRSVRETDRGLVVTFRCACGEEATYLSGRRVAKPVLLSHPTPAAVAGPSPACRAHAA
jgi:hypothetical protein